MEKVQGSLINQNLDRMEKLLIKVGAPEAIDPVRELIEGTDFLYAPASTRYHGAYPGGLFDHSMAVAELLVDWTEKRLITWKRSCSPVLVGLLHDWTKVGKYEPDPHYSEGDDISYTYASHEHYEEYGGHGSDSCIKLLQSLRLNSQEVACIRWHMGAYEGKDTWELFDAAIRKYPAVLWTHHADMVASKIVGV